MAKNLIILFYPKTEEENVTKNIPLALLKIGSALKTKGYDVTVIDERFEENYQGGLKKGLGEALFFGVSVMTGYQIQGALKASSFVRTLNNTVPVIWGGWHPSILPDQTLENKDIDIVVRAQGEITICEVARAIKEGKGLEDINGISYRKDGRIISTEPRRLEDLNDLGPVRFDVLDIRRYISGGPLGERSIFWNSSQGCPYCCGFCSTPNVYKRMWSGLKPETLIEEIKVLVHDYGIDGVTFAEDNFFVDTARIEKLCRGLIADKIRIRWATDARVDQINRLSDEFMSLLKESGCHKLYIGAESGDEEVLNLIDKKIKLEDTYSAAAKLDRFDIISEFFMIVGFPLDPEKDLKESLELIRNIKLKYPNHQFTPFLYTPYPGTPLIDLAVKYGLKMPKRLEDWVNWSILTVSTPWVDKRYVDRVNMYSKCFYPLAFPSSSLKRKMGKRVKGLPYRVLHRLARKRLENEFFAFPIEWRLVKAFHTLKMRSGLFRGVESFR